MFRGAGSRRRRGGDADILATAEKGDFRRGVADHELWSQQHGLVDFKDPRVQQQSALRQLVLFLELRTYVGGTRRSMVPFTRVITQTPG